jgi:hypothetical protein
MLIKLVSVGLKIANYLEFSDEEQFEPHEAMEKKFFINKKLYFKC